MSKAWGPGDPLYEALVARVGGAVTADEPLAPRTTLKVGGNARTLVVAESEDDLLAVASQQGRATTNASLLPLRALCNLGLGRLADAAADATDGVRLAEQTSAASLATSAASRYVLAVASLARDDADAALSAVSHPRAAARWGASPLYGWYLAGRGWVDLARGRHEQALEQFCHAGERFMSAGGPGAFCDWRSGAVLAARATGQRDAAAARAEEALALAESFGAPAAIAAALRTTAATTEDHADAVDLLLRAKELVSTSDAALEHARVEVDLGAALRRAGRRREAREHLRSAMARAERCGGRRLAGRVVEELQVAGARRPQLAVSGIDALTPSELRVARRAVAGDSNREIAEHLFVTRKTVETHLSNVYRKLAITTREQLPGHLGQVDDHPGTA